MPNLPPPPVPQKLREMLKDYPAQIADLQQSLNRLVEKPLHGIPPFERAIWLLEDTLSAFMSEARIELQAAEASGDEQAIAKAKDKDFTMDCAHFKGRWIGDEGLWEYFQTNKEVFE